MKFKAKFIDLSNCCIMHPDDHNALALGVHNIAEISIGDGLNRVLQVTTSYELVQQGEILIPREMMLEGINDGLIVDVDDAFEERGGQILGKMLEKQTVSKEEIKELIDLIYQEKMTPLHTGSFVLYNHFTKLEIKEVQNMAQAFRDSGNVLEFPGPVYDKHSTGGVPGNKVSLLIVPILAAAGLLIPKTSTKAITSAAGTIDTVQALGCETDFTMEETYEITKKIKACIISGAKLGIAPVVDKIISQAAYPLGLDPPALMLAGILSKKMAMGVEFMVLDVPVGRGAKFVTEQDGREYGRTFVDLAFKVGITAESGLTYGSIPVGHSIGPALEAREALRALIDVNSGPVSLIEKSTALAGIVLEMANITALGKGKDFAYEILRNGKAYEKMKQIIELQGGDPNLKPEDIQLGKYKLQIDAPVNGWPVEIRNKALLQVARAAGAPDSPGAGVLLKTKKESVKKGDTIAIVYSDSENAIDEVRGMIAKLKPIIVEGLLMERIK
ncbi:MAG: AMP phosphorylase [Candidatus Hodarchaeales archaeon]|jgi:AMP phosphorylase